MNWSAIGALGLALGITLGAFGAHALSSRIDAASMGIWRGAAFYHVVHALGLLIVPLLGRVGAVSRRAADWVCWLLLTGAIVFCGSLYLLALTGLSTLGILTPVGGFSFIAGWSLLGVALLRRAR